MDREKKYGRTAERYCVATGVALDVANVPQCELRRHTGERAHARIFGMQLTASGQVRGLHQCYRASTRHNASIMNLTVLAITNCALMRLGDAVSQCRTVWLVATPLHLTPPGVLRPKPMLGMARFLIRIFVVNMCDTF